MTRGYDVLIIQIMDGKILDQGIACLAKNRKHKFYYKSITLLLYMI